MLNPETHLFANLSIRLVKVLLRRVNVSQACSSSANRELQIFTTVHSVVFRVRVPSSVGGLL